MSVPNYTRFVSECLIQDPARQPSLSDDEIYGVYLSWFILNKEKPGSSKSLWAALSRHGHMKQPHTGGHHIWPGRTMTGPAAVDYILMSQPAKPGLIWGHRARSICYLGRSSSFPRCEGPNAGAPCPRWLCSSKPNPPRAPGTG